MTYYRLAVVTSANCSCFSLLKFKEHRVNCLNSSLSPFSSGRHADAIFTNSYRKVLGQISARKFLQTIMGKRLG